MGFFDSFINGLVGEKDIREIQQMENDYYNDELNSDYRESGLTYASSNHGWYKCIKCGKSYRQGDMDIDHIIPKSKGGSNSRYNLQCICKHCNRSKQADMSETDSDLRRRRKELRQKDKEDREFVKYAFDHYDEFMGKKKK